MHHTENSTQRCQVAGGGALCTALVGTTVHSQQYNNLEPPTAQAGIIPRTASPDVHCPPQSMSNGALSRPAVRAVQAMQPDEAEVNELNNHVLVMGYGRAGQLIGQMLSEQVIPWVAVDTNAEAVSAGRKKDFPVYFGDAGSPAVLHLLGAERASCAVIALDTPGANYRAVWAMAKHHPDVKLYVRAHDIKHGVNLEKAGATAVVPETLEPSLQLVAAVLAEFDYKGEEVSTIVDDFRRKHLTGVCAPESG